MASVFAFSLAGCNKSDDKKETKAESKTESKTESKAEEKKDGQLIKVGIINNDPNESGYRTANDADLQKMFTKENGYDASFSYSLKNEEQIQYAKTFIQNEVDYLLLSAADTAGWDSVLQDAKAAGVKVILFDRTIDADPSLYEASIVSDMNKEGETAVNWLLAQNLPEYKVIHIQGAMGSDAQIGRTGALDAQFASGKMKKVVQQTAGWDEAEAKKIVETVINSGEDFNVIYAENDGMAKGAVAALDENGIGRPSTYAAIFSNIMSRDYI